MSYADDVRVVPFFHGTQRSIGTGAMLDAKNQFGVGRMSQSKRKVKAQVKKDPGAALMDDLMLGFLTYWIRYGAQPEHEARRNADCIE